MDETTRLRMRRAHANHEAYCSCGRIVHGNGGKWNHRDMHERASDGHRYVTSTYYRVLFPGWDELPFPARTARKVKGPRTDLKT